MCKVTLIEKETSTTLLSKSFTDQTKAEEFVMCISKYLDTNKAEVRIEYKDKKRNRRKHDNQTKA